VTALVTGATGFVGSHVVDALLGRGEIVRALVRDPKKAPALEGRGVQVVVGNLLDRQALAAAVERADSIYHCAAAGADSSKKAIYETNLGGVRQLCEAMQHARAGRLVLVSGINVLGMRNHDRATEDLPYVRSGDPAADVKIEAEQAAMGFYRQGKIDLAIVRPGLIYGPGDGHNLPKLVDSIRRGKFAFIGSCDNVVPIVHVRDVAEALLLAGRARAASGNIYHITDGSRTTIGELVNLIADALDCRRPTRVLPYFIPYLACIAFELRARLGPMLIEPPITRAALRLLGTSRFVDIRRARLQLGYAPSISCRDGIPDTLRWISEHGVAHEPQHATQRSA
jgi:nucleoside-diphosphate-sugar epimerase